jgi:threonine dehydrogenase-like Zn-dependent dehydrogenase
VKRPVIVAEDRIEWLDYDLPDRPPAATLRLAAVRSLVSPGTELGLFRGVALPDNLNAGFRPDAPTLVGGQSATGGGAPFPVIPGYNLVGEVVAVGESVDPGRVGERCFALARHQPLSDVPAWEAMPLPTGLEPDMAVFSYLPTLGLASLRRLGFRPGQRVAVIGLGLVGGLSLLVAESLGADAVGIERSEARRRLWRGVARHSDVVGPDDAEPDRAEVVIEATGSPAALRLAMELAGENGVVGVLGMHAEPLGDLLARHFYAKRLSIVACRNDPHLEAAAPGDFTLTRNVRFVAGLLARKAIDPSPLVTHRLPADRLAEAYRVLMADDSAMAVVLEWARGTSR